jgi:hypothetical protein
MTLLARHTLSRGESRRGLDASFHNDRQAAASLISVAVSLASGLEHQISACTPVPSADCSLPDSQLSDVFF